MFNHFLITRFNVKVETWTNTKKGETILDEEWLKHRFYLFETYCLPSVKNQVNQNFKWLIFFDTDTSFYFKKKINSIAESYSLISIIYISGNHLLIDKLIGIINENEFPMNDFVITTRLDNDDLIHKDFIQTIQQNFKPCHNTIIDITHGYKVSIEGKKVIIWDYENNFNPFISLIEEKRNVHTILSRMHRDWKMCENLISIKKNRLWIELVHSKNQVNSQDFLLSNSVRFNPTDFGISVKNFYVPILKKIIFQLKRLF